MTQNPICANCSYWKPIDPNEYPQYEDYGQCIAIEDNTWKQARGKVIIHNPDSQTLAFLATQGDFYCALFEARNK